MSTALTPKVNFYRKQSIKKDLEELGFWIYFLESFNEELGYFNSIEKQLVKNPSIANTIVSIRRNNILMMANLCKYEQELKTEYEYGKIEYDTARARLHKQKRESYLQLIKEYNKLKNQIYVMLKSYHRK